jgi:hypothetical protein
MLVHVACCVQAMAMSACEVCPHPGSAIVKWHSRSAMLLDALSSVVAGMHSNVVTYN